MQMAIGVLTLVTGIGSLVCWIISLVKIFPDKESGGILKGIIGIICGIYAFCWGWKHNQKHNLKKVMIVWTVCIVLGIILNFAAGAMALSGAA